MDKTMIWLFNTCIKPSVFWYNDTLQNFRNLAKKEAKNRRWDGSNNINDQILVRNFNICQHEIICLFVKCLSCNNHTVPSTSITINNH